MESLVLHIFSAFGLINALALVRSEDFLRERERERERERDAQAYII
jgi:predicted outer membrane lipoprotein